MKITKEFVGKLSLFAVALGISIGMTYMWYEDYAIRKTCREACGTRRLIACHFTTYDEGTAFCQDSKTTMTVYELKR